MHAQLTALERDDSPFADAINESGVHWVVPEYVAEIAFTDWTTEGKLRHPSFVGLRDDKDAAEVGRERPSA
jgi:bifunctional non-homologous end joining protein LigD